MDSILYNAIQNRIQYLDGIYEAKKEQLQKSEDTVKLLETEEILLSKTEKVLKHLIDKLVQNDMGKMDNLVTYGLNTVYPDRDYKFESKIEERGKGLYVQLNTLFKNNVLDDDSKSSVQVIESFLLRILSLMKLKRTHLVYMDESFAAVDTDYMENVSKLLYQIAEKLKMDILVVTHNRKLSEYAHNAFEIKQDNNNIKIEKLKSKN